MGIIGLIVTMSMPSLTRYAAQMRLTTTTRQLVGLISLARSLAISSHEEHAVVIDPERKEVRIIKVASGEALEQVVHLPSSLNVELQIGGAPTSTTQLVFRPTGSLTGRTVSLILAEHDKHHTITVTGTTGSIGVE